MSEEKNKKVGIWTGFLSLISLTFILLSFIPSARYNLDFFTAHNQFYLADSGYVSNTGDDNFWSAQAYKDRVASADDVIGISIASYGHVKAQLNVLDASDKEKNFNGYDHVAEASVKISSGLLIVHNYPDSKTMLKAIVTPGTYRVRIYSYSLANVNPDDDEGTDHYKINLWKDNYADRKVLKQFEGE